MTRILVITSCTGEKSVTHECALTLDDFAQDQEHLQTREQELAKLHRTAAELYTGQQHVRLMRGVQAVQQLKNGADIRTDLWVLSAGYGLVPGHRVLAPYECTFQGMKAKELREWSTRLNVPTDFRKLVAKQYDLCLILLGDAYLKACQIDDSVNLGSPTLLFCGTGIAKRLPRLTNLRVVTLSNPEAKRFSCGLVGLKGEVAARLLERLASKGVAIGELSDPASDVLGGLAEVNGKPGKNSKARKPARPNPAVDRVVSIPDHWWRSPHCKQLRYFIPEWDDLVDPEYNFETDEHAFGASDWSNNVYAHQLYDAPNYDGILVSRVVAEKSKKKKARINDLGVHRFLRVPRDFPVMGDCGAFGYIDEDTPPYTTADVLDYYTRLDFDFGVSVDHLIVTATEDAKKQRYELTINNADQFIGEHRRQRLKWEPIGAVQGWDPESYANAAKQYVKMGYGYIALGGLVRSKTEEILAVVEQVRSVIPASMQLHLFGVARPTAIRPFQNLGINSVDSSAALRQAWMRTKDSYLLDDAAYAALRIPPTKGFRAKQMVEHASLDPSQVAGLEEDALRAVRAYATENCSLEACLDSLMEYDQFVTSNRVDMTPLYRRTLEDRPWDQCECAICRQHGIEVIVFRGNNRNRRRGFHNTFVFYEAFRRILAGEEVSLGRRPIETAQRLLFPVGEEDGG